MKKITLSILALALITIFVARHSTANTHVPAKRFVTVEVICTGLNIHTGAIPTVQFKDTPTGMTVLSQTIMSSPTNMNPAAGTYNVVITQTDNKSFSASITGNGSRSGQTLTFNDVTVSAGMMINISDD